MHHHQRKGAQFELFGPSESDPVAMPEWRSLPQQTRQQIIGLMARLLTEHRREHGTESEAIRVPASMMEEKGDV